MKPGQLPIKNFFFLLVLTLLFFSCRDAQTSETAGKEQPLSVPERVARAHGYEHWQKVREIRFTFNVDRDTAHFERNWSWHPKTGTVNYSAGKDAVSYNKTAVDSSLVTIDAAFVNDRFWLLAPFNLVWDKDNYHFTHTTNIPAPISGKPMHKLTIVYKAKGGYTPGDAYDFYFGDDYLLREWVFRKSNQPEPSLATTWEAYKEFNGVKLATEYRREDPGYLLHFTNLTLR